MKREIVLIKELPIINPEQQTLAYLSESLKVSGVDMSFNKNSKVSILVIVEEPDYKEWRSGSIYECGVDVVIPLGCLAKCLLKHKSSDITEDVKKGYWEFSAPFKSYPFKGEGQP